MTYEATANELRDRIQKLIPDHPEILDMTDPWELFKIEGFNCNDLQPSFAQASQALSVAKALHKMEQDSQ